MLTSFLLLVCLLLEAPLLISWRLLGLFLGGPRSQIGARLGGFSFRSEFGARSLDGWCSCLNLFAIVINLDKLIFLLFVVFVIVLLRIGSSVNLLVLGRSSVSDSSLFGGNRFFDVDVPIRQGLVEPFRVGGIVVSIPLGGLLYLGERSVFPIEIISLVGHLLINAGA